MNYFSSLLGIAFLILVPKLSTAQARITHTVFLVGDCGESAIMSQPLGAKLKAQIDSCHSQSTVLFLGDNIYPMGMPGIDAEHRKKSELIMATQAGWAQNATQGIFIPGNHDWKREKPAGKEYILNEQEWVTKFNQKNISTSPMNACSGPTEIRLTNHVVLLIIDTQWPLHRYEKGNTQNGCNTNTPEDLWKSIGDAYERNVRDRIILAGHHPMISYGEHGGQFTIMDHLFPLRIINPNLYIPLPVVGSIYPLYRQWFGHRQDIRHPKYRAMSDYIQATMAKHPGSISVAGHEHALEYIEKGASKFIVSGAGSKSTHVKMKGFAKFVASQQGFARIDILDSGELKLSFWIADRKNPNGKLAFTRQL